MDDVFNNPGFYVSYAVIQAVVVLLLIRLLDFYDRQPLGLLAVMAGWGSHRRGADRSGREPHGAGDALR